MMEHDCLTFDGLVTLGCLGFMIFLIWEWLVISCLRAETHRLKEHVEQLEKQVIRNEDVTSLYVSAMPKEVSQMIWQYHADKTEQRLRGGQCAIRLNGYYCTRENGHDGPCAMKVPADV